MGPNSTTPAFRETQWLIKNPWFAWVPLMFVVMYSSGFAALWLRGVATQTDAVMWVLTGLVVPALLCTWRLRTEVVDGEIRVSLPPVWGMRWSADLGQASGCMGFSYRVFTDYGAFGVRRIENSGWMWNAFGNDAVRVSFDGRPDWVIGTQRADELITALGVAESTLADADVEMLAA